MKMTDEEVQKFLKTVINKYVIYKRKIERIVKIEYFEYYDNYFENVFKVKFSGRREFFFINDKTAIFETYESAKLYLNLIK